MIGDPARLAAELAALAARAYPEIGVPAYLIAEDLAAAPASNENGVADDELAATFRALVDATADEPDAEVIAQLLELLADRHFLPSAKPSFSNCPALHPKAA